VAGVKFLNHAASGLILCSFSLKLCTFAEERSFVLDALTLYNTSIECVEHFSVYYESLRISTDKCIQVEIATRDQQANPFWEHCKKKNKH
jgi:hypothetical protein